MSDAIIKIEELRVIYSQGKSNEVRALDGINLEIYPEEYVIIHGPSGCGKSTVLYAIAGLQTPTYGDITLDGRRISRMSRKEKLRLHQFDIGMIFQAFYLISSIDVMNNVCLPKVFCGAAGKKRKEEGMKLLSRFGISEQADKFPGQLSGGQRQRVAIARALINNPKIILADEPVGNLDSESAQNVLDILKELNETDKKTVIMVTHNAEHLHYADRIVHMKDGKITDIEVRRDKRPKERIKEELASRPEEISNELKILMRTFKNLTPQQLGVMLVPFKAKQLLNHILSELTEEQMKAAENLLKEMIFRNINTERLVEKLDLDPEEGGAGWNKQRARSFSKRAADITGIAKAIAEAPYQSIIPLADYLMGRFGIELDIEAKFRFQDFLKLRIDDKIDSLMLRQRLDSPYSMGGLGLYRNTAEKITRELEIIMLLKYSA